MNVQAMSGNSMTPIQARVEEGVSSEHIPKPKTHGISRPSHPFTGWTSLVTLSKDGSAMRTTKSSLIHESAVISEKY